MNLKDRNNSMITSIQKNMINRIVPVYLTYFTYYVNRLTTITIRQNNYERLKSLGRTGESFNTVLGRLLDKVEKDQKK
ncbi:MAG: antitoxin VapB family protein [Nitrososphaeraceae archaeon]